MDLGATVCLPRKPACPLCPVNDSCVARREGNPESYPVKTRKLKRTAQSLWLLQARSQDGSVWLEKRPATGIWAGLYCLPVFESREALHQAVPPRARSRLADHAPFLHVLTHKDLYLHRVAAPVERRSMKHPQGAWFAAQDLPRVGLPAPVRRLLTEDPPSP
jgi:A/G-specific adenine glycosylase